MYGRCLNSCLKQLWHVYAQLAYNALYIQGQIIFRDRQRYCRVINSLPDKGPTGLYNID